jgi:hypothetical protein
MIIERLLYISALFSITSLLEFLIIVRDANIILRILYPYYYKTATISYGHDISAVKPTFVLLLPTLLPLAALSITSNRGDAIDLSIVWTRSIDRKRRPKNDVKQKA